MLNCYKQEALTIALRQEGSPESLWPRSLAGANQSHSTGFQGTALITSERAPAHIALVERTSDSNGRLGGGGWEVFYCPAECFSQVRKEPTLIFFQSTQ